MDSAQTLRRPALPVTTPVIYGAVLMAFILGGLGGYAAKAITTSTAAPTHAAAPCPQGMHPVVWYTAKTWDCSSDS